MVLMMPDLALVKIAQGIPHGAGGVGGEIALRGIEKPGSMSKRLLSSDLDLGEGKAGDVLELTSDLGR
jgi:hypothetical protein